VAWPRYPKYFQIAAWAFNADIKLTAGRSPLELGYCTAETDLLKKPSETAQSLDQKDCDSESAPRPHARQVTILTFLQVKT
jgi:hypothetical protein